MNLRVLIFDRARNKVVSKWIERGLEPGRQIAIPWNGYLDEGGDAPDGHYAFRVGPVGGTKRPGGRFDLHGYAFPVNGPHGTRGAIGAFGADRVDGRTHEGFDVTAACGTELLAARGGKVVRKGYDPDLYGNFIEIAARRSPFHLFYAHMRRPAPQSKGAHVRTREPVGRVGLTGNAAGTPCHLHLELRLNGRLIDPEPYLARWDAYS